MDMWTGTILPVGFGFAPEDWVMAHGQKLSVAQHQSLFSLMRSTYGGDDRTVFNLPDLRARVPVGYDETKAGSYGFGKTGGVESVSLKQQHLPAHAHAARFEPIKSTATVNIPAQAGSLKVTPKLEISSSPGLRQAAVKGDMLGASSNTIARDYTNVSTSPVELEGLSTVVSGTAATSATTAYVNDMIVGGTVTVEQAGAPTPQAFDTRMPYLAINFIICLQGLYPVRPS